MHTVRLCDVRRSEYADVRSILEMHWQHEMSTPHSHPARQAGVHKIAEHKSTHTFSGFARPTRPPNVSTGLPCPW
jgi:hypothetical protein